jgi:hypothetical protein
MFRLVACLGLQQWAPDVLGNDPESMYNLLHEHIALKIFEQVLGAFGYSHIGMKLSCINNFALMHKLYRTFVFSYMHGIAKSEAKNPGSVVKAKQMTGVWKQCSVVHNSWNSVYAICRWYLLINLDSLLMAGWMCSGHVVSINVLWHWLERMRPIQMMSWLKGMLSQLMWCTTSRRRRDVQ